MRANCKHPNECVAGRRGPCRKCHAAALALAAERMRKLNANPEFAKANAERAAELMRKLNADKRGFEVPPHLSDLYRLARQKGYSPRDALAFAERGYRPELQPPPVEALQEGRL